jgi:tetratricopeptide (TPR) repeat protein
VVKLLIALLVICAILFTGCVTNPAMEQVSLGDRYSDSHNWNDAIIQYQKALSINPSMKEAVLKLALAYSNRGWDFNEKGNWEKAIPDLDEAIKYDQTLAIAFNNRGRAYQIKGQSQLSSAYDFLNRLGDKDKAKKQLLAAVDSFTSAISDLNHSLVLKSDLKQAISNLANTYNDRGHTYDLLQEWDKAIADCTEALKLNPNLAQAYNDRCYAYDGKTDWSSAVPDCTSAIALAPLMKEAYNNRGWAYHELGEYYKALDDLDKAIQLDPNMSVAYLNRAITYFYLKNAEKVVEDCKMVLKLTKDPDQVWSAKQLASSVGVSLEDYVP